jgi:hypothetical protein
LAELELFPIGYVDDTNANSLGTSTSTPNLVTNGDMELDSNWADYGTPSPNEQANEQVHRGSYSRKFTANVINEGIKSDTYTSVTGVQYKYSFWFYTDQTGAGIRVRKGDDSGWADNRVLGGHTPNQWNYFEWSFTETAGGSGAYIALHSGSFSSGTWYIDDVILSTTGGNTMFEPNAGVSKQSVSYTLVKTMEDRSVWTYKKGEHTHVIEYGYENIWNSEYRLIKRFVDDIAEVGANDLLTISIL